MNELFRQRLVGALILVALGVVFWPIIFIDPDRDAGSLEAGMPERPGVDTRGLPSPDQDGLRASRPLTLAPDQSLSEVGLEGEAPEAESEPERPDPPADPAVLPQVSPVSSGESAGVEAAEGQKSLPVRSEAPQSPQLDEDGVPVAWMLQVVSVSSKESAEQARQGLEDMGHKAYVKRAEVRGKILYRVYVGPKFERARLEQIQAAVDAKFKVKSMVRRYYP